MVNFDPHAGQEMGAPHPAVVVSDDAVGALPLKIVVPVTGADRVKKARPWHIELRPSPGNGLAKPSVADTFQVKSVAILRFLRKMGELTPEELDDVMEGVLLCLGVPAP